MAARCASTASRFAIAPRQAVRDGIVYVTEDRKVEGFFETMSIAESIYLGAVAGGCAKVGNDQHVGNAGGSGAVDEITQY